jgi:integrase/recombinase XerD
MPMLTEGDDQIGYNSRRGPLREAWHEAGCIPDSGWPPGFNLVSPALTMGKFLPKERRRNLMLVTQAVSTYLRARRAEGYSPATLRQYAYQLRRFAAWVGQRDIEDLKLNDLREFIAGHDHLKAQSLGHVVRVLRGFFRWLCEDEVIDKNPALKLKEPKKPKAIPKALTFEELELLRDSCHTPLEHALVEFLFATGCRIGEVRGIDRDQIEWERKAALVLGKGQKEREVYFGARCNLWLRRYLATRSDEEPALFATSKPVRRMSTWYIRSIIKRVADRCGLSRKVSPHVMRHSSHHAVEPGSRLGCRPVHPWS